MSKWRYADTVLVAAYTGYLVCMLARSFHPEWTSPTILVNTAKFFKQFLWLDGVTSILRMLTGSDTQDLNVVGPLSHKVSLSRNILGVLYVH